MFVSSRLNMKRAVRLFALVTIVALGVLSLEAQEMTPTLSPDDIPEPMPLLDEGGYDIVNFLLLGADTTNPDNSGRTDVLTVISVNRTAGTVSMLSLPRDLYVYIPGYRVQRINTAFGWGETNLGEGTGAQLLIDTIQYNLGLQIDHYARVDFDGFRQIIDDLGGVEISVDCAIQDWRLREPDLDPTVEDNWEIFTLSVGVQTMDGDLALWYARSRRTSSDFDRGRRHQALLRALWHRIRGLNLIDQLSDVWPQVLETVQTDITLDDMLSLAPLALSLDTSHIASYLFRPNIEVTFWTSPEGASVLAPNRPAIAELEHQMIQPPTEHQLVREGARVEVVNASGVPELDQVAADRLAWEGFVPVVGDPASSYRDYTVIYDFTGQTKGSSLGTLQAALRVSNEGVIIEPDANRTVDFRVVIGGSYSSCTYGVLPPVTPTPEPEATAQP
jgi:LCP family protein required for cell wall assembly